MKKVFRFVSEASFVGMIGLFALTVITLKTNGESVTEFLKTTYDGSANYLNRKG